MDFPADIQSFTFDLESTTTFSPTVSISLSNLAQGSLSDINFTITQDADESDISSSIIVSDGGSFALSSLSIGLSKKINEVEKSQHFTKPPSRYSEASLVKKLEETVSEIRYRHWVV